MAEAKPLGGGGDRFRGDADAGAVGLGGREQRKQRPIAQGAVVVDGEPRMVDDRGRERSGPAVIGGSRAVVATRRCQNSVGSKSKDASGAGRSSVVAMY